MTNPLARALKHLLKPSEDYPGPPAPRHSVLVDIRREGKANVFTFVRGESTIEIRTYSTYSDDVNAWRRQLL